MAKLEFTASGKFITSSEEEIQSLVREIKTKLIKSAQEAIVRGFERSVELQTYVGMSMDTEALRAIIRSIKVVEEGSSYKVKFEDDLGHWYGGGSMPDELLEIINKISDEALNQWSRTSKDIVTEVLNGDHR